MNNQSMDNLLIEWQCQKLVTRSINLLDQGRWQELANCYTEEGELYRPSAPTVKIAGRDAILASFTARPAKETCHALTNMEANIINDYSVIVTSRVVLFSSGKKSADKKSSDKKSANKKVDDIESMVQANGDIFIGRFVDELKKIKGEWLIAKRKGSIELHYTGSSDKTG
ncbi:Nuclear transport factor 2 (NTF2) domain protein [Marinomonas spartinae]|uniref:nuclear transport factor 2 family protein n=1 Tax=Marinomonas spartinae TaxID=1792290 RepID=UPI000808BC43|nr:nuclear transport factor 2 family protein [Marinomonas spartinae]SBS40132.1 Nuclear transport factor 2 (NTF2) domain protein [Marinomonas spartinae]